MRIIVIRLIPRQEESQKNFPSRGGSPSSPAAAPPQPPDSPLSASRGMIVGLLATLILWGLVALILWEVLR